MYNILKESLDRSVGIILFLLLLPVYITLAILIKSKMGSPVLFKQVRPGRNAKPFTIYKFRTMTDACDSKGNLLSDEMRLTSFGQFLRRFSLDELPQLLNVIKGELSLVGPRPLLMEYLSRYSSEQFRRHEVKPGITGWAQVNGRNAISWEEKFELDVWYVDNKSFLLDLIILWKTLIIVIRSEGIQHKGQATMMEFKGSSHQENIEEFRA